MSGHHVCCSARWCSNNGKNTSARFFRFPKDDRYAAWLDFSNRMDLAELPKEQVRRSHYLCSEHFTDGDYADPLKKKLLWSAVPSVRIRGRSLTATELKAPKSPISSQQRPAPLHEGTTEDQISEAVAAEHQLSLEPGPCGLQKSSSHDDTMMERREAMEKNIRTGHKACCAARWCESTGRNRNLKFFRFPLDDRCDKWRRFADRDDLASLTPAEMNTGYRLCSEHFTDRDYMDPYKTRLLCSAVPSVKFAESSQLLFLHVKVIPGEASPSQDERAGERVAAVDKTSTQELPRGLQVEHRQLRHTCAALWCDKGSTKFFRFPKDDRCKAWVEFTERKDLAELSKEQLNRSYRLCALHFKDKDYNDPRKTRLVWNAVPSVKALEQANPATELRLQGQAISQASTSKDAGLAVQAPSSASHFPASASPLERRENDGTKRCHGRLQHLQSDTAQRFVLRRRPVLNFKRCRLLSQLALPRKRSPAPEVDYETTIPEPLEVPLSAKDFFLLGETCGSEADMEVAGDKDDCSNSNSGSVCMAEGMDCFMDDEDTVATRTIGLQTEECDAETTTFSSRLCHMTWDGVATEVAHKAADSAPMETPSRPREEPKKWHITYIVY
ncbi:uncharacterized protein LOC119446208 isoform X2 [Dermacentor silvarum]|uniref:uncharacterized protein LOC119446208 isoform X2 n=1 Tax=Dermacentor silvarum TaxID=543639 RepID=UPI002101BD90|nr:uncharacterized protein LOC119446208 isoform X2 [Dermacentor silvarum]